MIDRNRFFKDLLWVLALAGALAIVFRLWYGLGPTTELSDAVPWGLWKILNMVAGVALATGGFTVGFLVYVLRIERFRPLVKPAILVAFLGYGSSCFALLLDIGLPHRIWHPILMWNGHSFLFEVAWCVMLYFTVTMVELSPTVLERLRLERPAKFLHRIAFGWCSWESPCPRCTIPPWAPCSWSPRNVFTRCGTARGFRSTSSCRPWERG